MDSLVAGCLVLTAHIDSGGNVEDSGVFCLLRGGSRDVRLDLIEFFLFNVAVKQQSGVILVVISHSTELTLVLVRILSQLFEVSNQIIQLWHLNKSLNHI